jgi:hypothetical protein
MPFNFRSDARAQSGDPARDVFGCQQYGPLFDLELPR